ncbi:MAG TPA: YciI family protein [Gemmatales bacterium]|nr:YciI family protein [Gemmatales bacterium]HMP59540.1 YciI family protein [Gemmatales bacterium]
MRFPAVFEYTPDKAKIAAVRPRHRQYLTGLLHQGKLLAAGPLDDDAGALIIYEADSRAAAETLIQNDPFFQEGVMVKYQLFAWKPVLANRSLLPE